MRIGIRWRHAGCEPGEPHIIEVVTPRTNAAALTSAENFFASLALDEPCSVELAADAWRRQFLVRASTRPTCDQVLAQLSAAYPQADFRVLSPDEDPAIAREGEQVVASTFGLRAPAYLPLRTFTDLDVDGERAVQADPMLGMLSALGEVPAGWRGLTQLALTRADENWYRDYQRYAVQHPLEHEHVSRPTENVGPTLVFIGLLLGLVCVGLEGRALVRAEQWLQLGLLAVGSIVGLCIAVVMARRLGRPALYDMDLVREKVTRLACRVEIRLLVYAPVDAPIGEVRAQLDRVAAAYRRFNLAAANGLIPRPVRSRDAQPQSPSPWRPRRSLTVLTTRELAGIWHLPHATADVALLERTDARRWLPLPAVVADGCRIGVAQHQGRQVPVALPVDVLRRHMLLVAKTRRGKSTLMQRLARQSMQAEPRRAVLLVDPHRDLAESLLGVVPPERADDVVFLDVANRARPFGLNLLDTGLGWDRDRAVANALSVFQREWGDQYWGPRMEDAFRFGLMTLFDANVALCRADPADGRAAQYTLLDIPAVFSDTLFRRELLKVVTDPTIHAWWSDYFEPLDRRFQAEIVNPVLTKIHRFDGSTVARNIVGQPMSSIDPSACLRDGAIIVVNTARGMVGENAAALIGSTLLNLMTLAVAEQAGLQAGARRPISIYVDEFHTIPGADYESILAELGKYGANLVLATQSLARLLALGQEEGRGLRATVFANLDGLFAFNCSAEDAEYLVPELGGALDEQDLVELGEHQCYVRLSSAGRRLPTFSVHLDPPLAADGAVQSALARASAERFGRDAQLVEAERRAALERISAMRARYLAATATQPPSVSGPTTRTSPRNEHRPRKKRREKEVVQTAAPAG